IQIGHGAFFTHIGETHGLGLQFLLAFLLQIGQPQVLKDHGRQFFHGDFGLIVVVSSLFAGIALLALAGARLLGDNIANFTFAIALASVLLATWIIAETIFVEGANGDTDSFCAIGQDDALFTNDFA